MKISRFTDVTVAVLEHGSADAMPIICVHGIQGNKTSYREFLETAETRGFRGIALDLVGFGDSSRPDSFSYDLRDQAQVIADLALLLGIDTFHLVGHSIGGMIATHVADLVPTRVQKIVSLEGNLLLRDGSETTRVAAMSFEEFKTNRFPALKQQWLDKGVHLRYESLSKVAPHAFYRTSQSVVHWTSDDEMLKLFEDERHSKLFIKGGNSHFVTKPTGSRIRYVVIPEIDHLALLPNTLVSDEIFRFL